MSKLVTIYGGSGFVGRYIARRMAKAGWRVRVAVRRPNQALFVRPYGVVGQVEPVLCNILDDASVRQAMSGADVVVNCVGILHEIRKNRFEAIQAEGATRVARIAAEEDVSRMVHISAIGADVDAASDYSRSKGNGEAGVLAHFPNASILRPSIIFGAEDEFFNRFAKMTRFGPVLPIAGADTQYQPVFVDDVAKAAEVLIKGDAPQGLYELGGPDVESLRGLLDRMLGVIHRRRLILNMPKPVARMMAFGFGLMQSMSFGLLQNRILTRDQLINLMIDNVVSPDTKGFDALGVEPTSMEAVLPDYLWPYRPSGQYDAIMESARNLRSH